MIEGTNSVMSGSLVFVRTARRSETRRSQWAELQRRNVNDCYVLTACFQELIHCLSDFLAHRLSLSSA